MFLALISRITACFSEFMSRALFPQSFPDVATSFTRPYGESTPSASHFLLDLVVEMTNDVSEHTTCPFLSICLQID